MPDIYVIDGGISTGIFLALAVVAVCYGLFSWARSKHGGWDD